MNQYASSAGEGRARGLVVDFVFRLNHRGPAVGGTGRFAGAWGQSRTVGEGSLVTNTGRLATSGTLRY